LICVLRAQNMRDAIGLGASGLMIQINNYLSRSDLSRLEIFLINYESN
jgi:hypothetical protein